MPRNEATALVEAVIAEISEALERGEMVKISSFGTFAVRQKGPRVGRNPKTMREVLISPRRVLVFRAARALKHQINHAVAPSAATGNDRGAPIRAGLAKAL